MLRCTAILNATALFLISKSGSVNAESTCKVIINIRFHNMPPSGNMVFVQMPKENSTHFFHDDQFFTTYFASWSECFERKIGFWSVSVLGIGVHFELNEDHSHFVVNGSVTMKSIALNAYPINEQLSVELSAEEPKPNTKSKLALEPKPKRDENPTCNVRIVLNAHALPLSGYNVSVEMPSKKETYRIWFNNGIDKLYSSNWTMCTANDMFGIWTVSINNGFPRVSFLLSLDQPYFIVSGGVYLGSNASIAEIRAYDPADEVKAVENLSKTDNTKVWPMATRHASTHPIIDKDYYWIDSVAKTLRNQEDAPNIVELFDQQEKFPKNGKMPNEI